MSSIKSRPKKDAAKQKGNMRSIQARRDDDIMNTNDSSIVSKRSVSKLYFPQEPDFYQPFVQKYARRNPLINRGYWLRMHAIEQVVRCFLEDNSNKKKVIVNLGCGYDPLPFQFWHRYTQIAQNATFVDVDYPQLIERKRNRMLTDNLLRTALLQTGLRASEAPVALRSDQYMALGCDLRDLKTLERILRTEFDLSSSSLLFIAEVSLTYMPLADSDTLIRWASTLEDSRFCMLEQFLPQGQGHPFAKTMLNHFDKLQTPIQAVKTYPSLELQATRFKQAGWHSIDIARNMWDLWQDNGFTPPNLRCSLDDVEPFDEWEEFALFSGHYFVIVASNSVSDHYAQPILPEMRPVDCQSVDGIRESSVHVSLNVVPSDAAVSLRRFCASFALGQGTVAFHGGQGPQHRLSSINVLHRDASSTATIPLPVPQPRSCHTITAINETDALLIGGRQSPSQALADCWLMNEKGWEQVHDLQPARFRHSSAKVIVPRSSTDEEGVLVFGGKTSEGGVLDECSLWTSNKGWQIIPVVGARPQARFGAAMSPVGASMQYGFIAGGMRSDGTVLDDLWEYTLSALPEPHVRFINRTADIHDGPGRCIHARFGSTLVPFGDAALLIGGIFKEEILGLSDEIILIARVGNTAQIERSTVVFPGRTWPLLVGFGAAATSTEEVVVAGGGAVCFSMGSYWNEGCLSITKASADDRGSWSASVLDPAEKTTEVSAKDIGKVPENGLPEPKLKKVQTQQKSKKPKAKSASSRPPAEVRRIRLQTAEDFSQLLSTSKPAILEGLNLGPCTSLWTIDYLKEKIGPEREIVIHDSQSPLMTFQSKNFQYVKQSVGTFLDGISNGSKTYLRAVSAAQPNKLPTKLEDDFPTIASDFHIPDELSAINDTYHSSPLRISGLVSLWLHYDVLANVLCQIQGSKTLRLYPPSDVKYLNYSPGSSSSNTNVINSKDPRIHPHIARLNPGDVLFIPPMWSHTATPEEGWSVAVNVFFKNLDKGYAAGKDVYGNRDLQAYENGRRDVERIAKAFREVPADLARFYLDRLVGELQDKANAI